MNLTHGALQMRRRILCQAPSARVSTEFETFERLGVDGPDPLEDDESGWEIRRLKALQPLAKS